MSLGCGVEFSTAPVCGARASPPFASGCAYTVWVRACGAGTQLDLGPASRAPSPSQASPSADRRSARSSGC